MRLVKWICVTCMWTTVSAACATDPPQDYEPEMRPGGLRNLNSCAYKVDPRFLRPTTWRFPPNRIRGVYDAAGLPKLGSTKFRPPDKRLRWAPQTLKRQLLEQGIRVASERWTIDLNGTLGVRWVASLGYLPGRKLRPPFDRSPLHLHQIWNGNPDVRSNNPPGWDHSLEAEEHLFLNSISGFGTHIHVDRGTTYVEYNNRLVQLDWRIKLDRGGRVVTVHRLVFDFRVE